MYLKNVPPLWFLPPLLRNPGDGLDPTTALDTGMQRQDKANVANLSVRMPIVSPLHKYNIAI